MPPLTSQALGRKAARHAVAAETARSSCPRPGPCLGGRPAGVCRRPWPVARRRRAERGCSPGPASPAGDRRPTRFGQTVSPKRRSAGPRQRCDSGNSRLMGLTLGMATNPCNVSTGSRSMFSRSTVFLKMASRDRLVRQLYCRTRAIRGGSTTATPTLNHAALNKPSFYETNYTGIDPKATRHPLLISLAAAFTVCLRLQAVELVGHDNSVSLAPSGTISQCSPVLVVFAKYGFVGHLAVPSP